MQLPRPRPRPKPADSESDDEPRGPEPSAPATRVTVRLVHQDAHTTVYQVCAPPTPRLHVGAHVALHRADGSAIGVARRVAAMHAPERHNVNLVLQRAAADEPELLLNVSLARGWVTRLPAWARDVWESPARERLPATYDEPDVWGQPASPQLPDVRERRALPQLTLQIEDV